MAGAWIAALSTLYKAGASYFQKQKADELLAKLGERPEEQIPSEVIENQTRAKIGANVGMPAEQYKLAQQNIRRQQMNALKTASDRRNALALVPAIQQTSNDATLKLDSANAQQRILNQRYLDTINSGVAAWKSKLFNENVRKAYDEKYNYAMSLKGSANQNMNSAIDTGIAALAQSNINKKIDNIPQDSLYEAPAARYTSTGELIPKNSDSTSYISPVSNPNPNRSTELSKLASGFNFSGNKPVKQEQAVNENYGDAWGNYIKRRMMYKF